MINIVNYKTGELKLSVDKKENLIDELHKVISNVLDFSFCDFNMLDLRGLNVSNYSFEGFYFMFSDLRNCCFYCVNFFNAIFLYAMFLYAKTVGTLFKFFPFEKNDIEFLNHLSKNETV